MEFETKLQIVADAWIATKGQEAWRELREYGDIGFPLAYAVSAGFAKLKGEQPRHFIEEVYSLILASLELPEGEYLSWQEINDLALEKQSE